MKYLEKLKRKLQEKEYTISDLKNIYEEVNTKGEVIVTKRDDKTHLYYRNHEKRTLIIEKDLLPYEKIIHSIKHHPAYPLDLCCLKFYDEEINRYGQGIIIPRIKKFTMVDDIDLIKEPTLDFFYKKGIKENNRECASIVDRKGNLYHIYGYSENDDNFDFKELKTFDYESKKVLSYGILVYYNSKPVYAEIKDYPYTIMDKEELIKCSSEIFDINKEIPNFDDTFMQGKRYIKK